MRRGIFPKSIRWQLQLWLAFLLVCVLSGFGVAVFQLHRLNQFNQIDEELQRRVSMLSAALHGRPPFGPGGPPFGRGPGRFGPDDRFERRPPPPDQDRPEDALDIRGPTRELKLPPGLLNSFEGGTNSFYFAVWSRNGTILKASTNAPPNLTTPAHRAGDTRTYARTRETFREIFHFTERGDCVLAGHSVKSDLKNLQQFTFWLVVAGVGVLALGCGGGWWLASAAIRPMEEISAAANRISAGNLSERIQEPDPDNELGQLAGVLNSTFDRLEAAFAQQKQFTADAAHELRTPLAVLISETQTTLARERTAAEYREAVEVCLNTAQHMRGLTESLLALARIEARNEKIPRQPIDVAEITRSCLEHVCSISKVHAIKIECDLAPAVVFANAERLSQIITNLLTNAIYYNKPNGQIKITTQMEQRTAVFTIADTGQGISKEDLPHIFDRFYRADKSRSRADGHSGLGLAICKSILDAVGGTIEVSSQLGIGTQFMVRLPAHEV